MKQDVCVSYLKTKCVVSVLVVLWWENKRRVETERNKKLKKREEMISNNQRKWWNNRREEKRRDKKRRKNKSKKIRDEIKQDVYSFMFKTKTCSVCFSFVLRGEKIPKEKNLDEIKKMEIRSKRSNEGETRWKEN